MRSGGDPNVTGPRERRNVMIDDQPESSETIPASEEAAVSRQQADYFTFAEPEVAKPQASEPSSEASRSFGDRLSSFLSNLRHPIRWWRYRRAAVSTHPVPADVAAVLESSPQANSDPQPRRTVIFAENSNRDKVFVTLNPDGGVSVTSENPYDIAQLLYFVDSHGRPVHKPLSAFAESMTTFVFQQPAVDGWFFRSEPMQQFAVAGRFMAAPGYDSKDHFFAVAVGRDGDSAPMNLIYDVLRKFRNEGEREIVESIDHEPGGPVTPEAVRRKLLEMFYTASLQRANHLGVALGSDDARLVRMREIGRLLNWSVVGALPIEGDLRILETGVGVNREGEVAKFVVRFVKKAAALIAEEYNFQNVITWTGIINPDGLGITWHYHEKYKQSEAVGGYPPSAEPTGRIVQAIMSGRGVPIDVVNDSEIIAENDDTGGQGGQTPQGLVAPASPATPSSVTGLAEAEGEVSSGGHQGSAERHAGLAVRMGRAVYRNYLPQILRTALPRRVTLVTPFAPRAVVPVYVR